MNPVIGAEQVAAQNMASNIAQAPRVALASTTLSPQSDYRVVLNAPSGLSPVVSLPAGVNGQTFAVSAHPSNNSPWTIAATGGNTLGTGVAAAMAATMASGAPFSVQHSNGVWVLA
jgi:hypothetical protein